MNNTDVRTVAMLRALARFSIRFFGWLTLFRFFDSSFLVGSIRFFSVHSSFSSILRFLCLGLNDLKEHKITLTRTWVSKKLIKFSQLPIFTCTCTGMYSTVFEVSLPILLNGEVSKLFVAVLSDIISADDFDSSGSIVCDLFEIFAVDSMMCDGFEPAEAKSLFVSVRSEHSFRLTLSIWISIHSVRSSANYSKYLPII